MPRVRVVVSDEKKQRWQDYVGETPEYDSVSDLVRKSVEQEINSESNSQMDQYEELYQIMEAVESLEKKHSRLQDSLDAHRQNSITKSDMDELESMIGEAIWEYANMIRDLDGNQDSSTEATDEK
ncbi:hypothetical protein [Halomicrobium sp. LC1Hm]|uniref:hypothetical protein n=1 Tax=Halomicrobium sp. LC1Hm TaxID=2610902 RepID=UPI0012984789|nr:hypothetical protein [Halomicrobium sp. LC1Hm]QGA82073.1 CopG/RHH family DNA binding protein [Halomicrobium sp. LC1Hm]